MPKKYRILTIGLWLSLVCSLGYSQGLIRRVLFIGNSYTASNNLPQLIQNLASSSGDSLIWDWNCPGGATFQGHSTNSTTLQKITQPGWDFVVLQEQSQRPAFPPSQVQQEVYPYATFLDSLIHVANPCAKTMFFLTWGRKNGDASNCPIYPPICTYAGMQERLRESYLEMTDELNAICAPVGSAWHRSILTNSAIELYSPDESHPSLLGSYLAACVFYASLYHKSPIGLSAPSGISVSDRNYLQGIAHHVVFDSLQTFRTLSWLPVANFTFIQSGNTFNGYNSSQFANSFFWDFGDGNTSTDANPVHVYNSGGTYTVRLIASNGCLNDTITQTVLVTGGCAFTPTINPPQLILCPNDTDTLFTQTYDSYQWFKDGIAIPGATNSYLVVGMADVGSTIKVVATLNGCSEESAEVLVDSWVFLFPTVMTSGDPPRIGTSQYCIGDTVILELLPPYDTNIQWYNNGNPIPGANSTTLIVTQTGNYTCSGAPSICPNYLMNLGVSINLTFVAPIIPSLHLQNDTLISSPAISYQWFLNNQLLPGQNQQTLALAPLGTVLGCFTVLTTDQNQCVAMSDSAFCTITSTEKSEQIPAVFLYPNPATHQIEIRCEESITQVEVYSVLGEWIQKIESQEVQMIPLQTLTAGFYFAKLKTYSGKEYTIKFQKLVE
ncbi:MAG: PKD domain-containing protein [Bacteroidia bacterium]|nr:PKD domain-containing protein [Bacteroidia bacterium]